MALSCTLARAGTVQIDLVPVGDIMNLADTATGYGSVSYAYSMGKYDVTMGQYMAFLNSVATTSDPYGCWNASMSTATPTYGITRTSTTAGFTYALRIPGSADVPVTFVNWGSAARFVNWLQNGEPNGPEGPATTETGTYALNGSTGSAALMAVTRGSNADWILPNVNEWYKASYYAGGGTGAGYWLYPTQNNSVPSNVLSATGTNNANFVAVFNQPPFTTETDPTNWLTPVGAFADSPGPYGTFDMGGDVWQWNETSIGGAGRDNRGGSFASGAGEMTSYAGYGDTTPTLANESVGFRVAYVPEPVTAALLAVASAAALVFRATSQIRQKTACVADSVSRGQRPMTLSADARR
jgi:formylglycine-generating enzyme required for sulfatase activity